MDQIRLFIYCPKFSKGQLVKIKWYPPLEGKIGIILTVLEDDIYAKMNYSSERTYEVIVEDRIFTLYETLLEEIED